MTMGTLVTIVLLTVVLILGGYLISKIFTGATENIDSIDQSVKGEINKLFSENSERKVVVYPATGIIRIQKGKDTSGFGLSIRNVKQTEDTFSYKITAMEVSCPDAFRLTDAEALIALGKERAGISIPAGTPMEYPIFVRFAIPEDAPPCLIGYSIDVSDSKGTYSSTVGIDLEIKSK